MEENESGKFVLYKNGYEPYIDFLKGYLILCILFTHSCQALPALRHYSLYYLWGCAPTGCFMLISSLHFFRNGIDKVKVSVGSSFKRILLPFLVLQTITIAYVILRSSPSHFTQERISDLLYYGGYGVGSYFPWVFIQYLLMMIALTPIIRRIKNENALLLLFLLISVAIEVLCSCFSFDDRLYRITVLRFPFLIYLGLLIDKEGIYFSKLRMFFALLGLFFVLLFVYGHVNMEPLFYNSSWQTYHWICYPYLAFFLLFLVSVLYKKTLGNRFSELMIRIGKASYGIFLFQAMWYLLPFYKSEDILLIAFYIPVSIVLCTICGVLLKERVLDYTFNKL